MLLTQAEKKPDVKWLYVSHEKVTLKNIMKTLVNPPEEMVWLRQENLILHVACRTIDDANKLLKISRDIGLRRSGIIADSNIIIVEICSTEKMDVPVSKNGKLIVSNDYIKTIVKIANEKFLKGREKLKSLEKDVREKLD
jgi:tRNA wybutosine-synthesizing protein 3